MYWLLRKDDIYIISCFFWFAGNKLVVVNMSQQTDSADLLGGWVRYLHVNPSWIVGDANIIGPL